MRIDQEKIFFVFDSNGCRDAQMLKIKNMPMARVNCVNKITTVVGWKERNSFCSSMLNN